MTINREEIKKTALALAEVFLIPNSYGKNGIILALKLLPEIYETMRKEFKEKLATKSISREDVKCELLVCKFVKIYLEKFLLSSPHHFLQ